VSLVSLAGVEPVDYRMNKGLAGWWHHLGTTFHKFFWRELERIANEHPENSAWVSSSQIVMHARRHQSPVWLGIVLAALDDSSHIKGVPVHEVMDEDGLDVSLPHLEKILMQLIPTQCVDLIKDVPDSL
jgi:hypothetical protein